MQAVINDEMSGIQIVMVGPDDGYAPDIMDDLCRRALDTYMSALIKREVVANIDTEGTEGDDDE